MDLGVTYQDINAARRLLNGVAVVTPTVAAPRLSALTGVQLALKLESLQHTASFKPRGAYVKLSRLSAEEKRHGVIAMSAGNHAQGVAYHAAKLGIPAVIVMPKTTPFTKIQRTESLGANVVVEGAGLSEAAEYARNRAKAENLTFIHPYDDSAVVAGQGTVGAEMLEAEPDLDVLVIPIGGGGLIAGCAIAARALKPSIKLIGVQAALYPGMARRMHPDWPAPTAQGTLAEGIAVKEPGQLTGRIVDALVDDIVTVSEESLERAVNLLLTEERLVAEGAGAASLAAVLANPARFAGQKVGLVVSGGNIDPRVLASILMRGLSRDGRIARLRVEISDQPGTLARVAGVIAACGGNIIEVFHQRLFSDVPVMRADLDVVIETRGAAHLAEIEKRLAAEGLPATRLHQES